MRVLKFVPNDIESFEVEPTEGYYMDHSFVDYESGLFVFYETPLEQLREKIQTPRKRLVEPETGKVLTVEEWRAYFDYESPREEFSEDGEIKCVTRRVHEPERETDGLAYQVIRVATGEVLAENSSIAFIDEPLRSPIQNYYDTLEWAASAGKALELRDYPEDIHRKHLEQVEPGEWVFQYVDLTEMTVLRLIFMGENYELHSAPTEGLYADIKEELFTHRKSYPDIAAFWKEFAARGDWFEAYGHRYGLHACMAKFVITSANEIRKRGDFTLAGYELLNKWENDLGDDECEIAVYHQFCPNCKARVYFQARYPKSLCNDCRELITDKSGRPVNYFNTELMGHGCAAEYLDTGEPYESDICFIGQVEYTAQEARFGGIELQPREEMEEASFPGAGYMRFRETYMGPVRKYMERSEYEDYINALKPGYFPSRGRHRADKAEIGRCPHCNKRVVLLRVKQVLCETCRALVTDAAGRPVRFERIRRYHGFQGYFRDTGEFYNSRACFLGGHEYQVGEFHEMYIELKPEEE